MATSGQNDGVIQLQVYPIDPLFRGLPIFNDSQFGAATSQISGSTSLVFAASASVGGKGELAGQSTLTFTVSGDITNAGGGASPIAGSTGLTFSSSATIAGRGAASGSTSLTFTGSGDLTNATPSSGSISGSTSLAFTCSGVLTNATPEESTQFGVGGGGSAWNGKLHRIKQDDEQVMKLVIEAFSKLVA